MIRYGGVGLIQPTEQTQEWIAANIPAESVFNFFRPRWLGDPTLNPRAHFDWVLSRPVKLNTFFYPWGASRWGIAYAIVDDNMLATIRTNAYAGSSYVSLPFVMDNDLGDEITTNLWMLPPIPFSSIQAANPVIGRYLLVLVDDRYFWWEKSAAITITEGTTTWSTLFSSLASALGITLTVDSIASAYLKPGRGLAKNNQYLPLMLDWAAASVGHRVVRTLAGAFLTRTAISALALQTSNAAGVPKVSGGNIRLGVVTA